MHIIAGTLYRKPLDTHFPTGYIEINYALTLYDNAGKASILRGVTIYGNERGCPNGGKCSCKRE